MKKAIGFLIFVLLFGAACIRYVPYGESEANYPRENAYDRGYGRYDDLDSSYFYDQLQPYGIWVSFRPYGYVWIPGNVGYKWRPYSHGHWAWTDYGWTWVSLERWGWIAYHYGRWGFDRGLGWFWVPDIVWGPAWVAWRWGDAHIGWAPLPPGADFMPGRGFGPRQWDIPGHYWSFVRGRDFLDRDLDRWVLPEERNLTIINLTIFDVNLNVRDKRVVNDGVDIEHVRRLTNRAVEKYALKEAPRAGQDRQEGRDLVIFKPEIKRNETAQPKQVVEQDKAAQQLDSERAGRVYRRVPRNESQALREDHNQEKQLMQESQKTEINEILRKAGEEKAKVQNTAEKQKVDEQVKTRVAELKKKHEEEKTEMTQRQKAEAEKTKKAPVKKKIDKN